MTAPSPDAVREGVLALIAHMRERAEAQDAQEPHALLMTDPETGHRQIVGPFTDKAAAEAAIVVKQDRDLAEYQPPRPTYEAVPYFTPEKEGLTP